MSDNENTLGYIDAGLTDDVPAWDGTTSYVRPGEYIVEVTGVKGGQSNSGGPKMVVDYKVVEAIGELAEENKDQVDQKVVQSYSLKVDQKGVQGRLQSIVKALLGGADERGGFDPNDLVGCQMACEIAKNDYSKADPVTGEKTLHNSIKMQRERHLDLIDAPAEEAAPVKAAAKPAPEAAAAPAGNGTATTATRGRRTPARRPNA
jgi:hypothetical protein